jgi:hypothetical protein
LSFCRPHKIAHIAELHALAGAIRRPAEGNVMIELLEQQKKLTTNQWKLICTANLADLLDFFDFFLIGYVTAALTKQWSLTYLEAAESCLPPALARFLARSSRGGSETGSAVAGCS